MKNINKQQQGFTLVEIMIAVLVLAIGLLGLAALQAASIKANQGAFQRTQAIFLTNDIMDRMRANRLAAVTGNYNRNIGDGIPADVNPATPTLAVADVAGWLVNFVQVLLPAGDAGIACVPNINNGNFVNPINGNATCTITMQWDESRVGGSASAGANNTQFIFTSQL